MPLSVRVGDQLLLRLPAGVIHVEARDPSIVAVTMPSPDIIALQGIRPADTALLLVSADTLTTQPVRVTPALILSGVGAPGGPAMGFVDLSYLPQTQTFWAEVHRPGLDATVSPDAWQIRANGGNLAVIGASSLQTPLQAFGVPGGWGVSVRTTDGWEIIGSESQSQVAYHRRLGGPDEFTVAGTTAGPFAAIHLAHGAVGLDLAALFQNGAEQTAGVVTATAGSIQLAYSFGPQGGGVSARTTLGGLSIGAAAGPQGLQAGLGANLGPGSRVDVWWTAQGGYGLGMMLPVGDGGTVNISSSPGSISALANLPQNPNAAVTGTAGFGAGQLSVTGPSPDFPVALAPAAALRLSTPPQPLPGTSPSPLTPYLVRMRIEIPAGAATASPALTGRAGPGPVTVPTGSAALITHICLHSASAATTCAPEDPTIAIRVYVDGRPADPAGFALPIAPGPHTVSIDQPDIPVYLVPLGPLACPITVAAGGVAVCDFAFRRAGAP